MFDCALLSRVQRTLKTIQTETLATLGWNFMSSDKKLIQMNQIDLG